MSGYPNRAESEHDWIENSHASTAPLLRPRDRQRVRAPGHRRRAQGGRRRRRRRPHRRHGLRGAEQPRALAAPRGDRAQRQRPLLRADGLAAVPEPDDPAPQPHLHRGPRAPAPAPARAARPGRAGLLGRALGDQRAARDGGAAHLLRGARACATPDRSTATTSSTWSRPSPTPPSGTARSWSTCSPRRAAATRPPKRTTSSACTTSRRTKSVTLENTVGSSAGRAVGGSAGSDGGGIASPGSAPESRGRRVAAARRHLHRRLLPGAAGRGRGRPADRGAHRGHARPDRPAGLPGPLPRPLLRRRHRRAARGHRGRRHGHGRAAARGGGLLDLLRRAFDQANLDVGLHGCPSSSCSTGPASPATTGRATTASSTWPWRCPSPA